MKIALSNTQIKYVVRTFSIVLVFCLLYFSVISRLDIIKTYGLKIFDSLFTFRYNLLSDSEINNKIAILALDDSTINKTGLRVPWPRGVIADIVDKVSKCKPKIICLDLVFAGKSEDESQDIKLRDSLKNAKNVYIGTYYGANGSYIKPYAPLAEAAKGHGFLNMPRDPDGNIRRMKPFMFSPDGKNIYHSMSLLAASDWLGVTPQDIVHSLPLYHGSTAYNSMYIDKKNRVTLPVWKILEGEFDPMFLKGRIVFIGVTSELMHDTHKSVYGIIPGVFIIANEALTYISGQFFKQSGLYLDFIILFLLLFLFVYEYPRISEKQGFFLYAYMILIFLVFEFFLISNNIILDPAGGIITLSLAAVSMYVHRYIRLVFTNKALKKEATKDGLTGLYVFRYFELAIEHQFESAVCRAHPLSLLALDIDHFKQINDTYGHQFGNKVLKAMAEILTTSSRGGLIISRYGGDEFFILMPMSGQTESLGYAKRITRIVKNARIVTENGKDVGITLSIGIASNEGGRFKEPNELIQAADQALYDSKHAGRDRISVYHPPK